MPENHSFQFGTRKIAYTLSFEQRKTLGIRVHPDCSVRVIAPFGTPVDKIVEHVRKRAPWILKQLNEFLSYQPHTPPRQFVNGETHLYLGRQYRLKVERAETNEVKIYRGRMIIKSRPNSRPATILAKWYREQATKHFNTALETILPMFQRYKIERPVIQLLAMRSRWGSCTPNGKIILNPELIKAPKGSIEYVIIHELCHLVHHNHTSAFYALQSQMMPDWKKWKERLERALA